MLYNPPSAGFCVFRYALAARSAAVSLFLFFGLASTARCQLNFNFTYDVGTDARAVAGFQQAANSWSARITDPITINLNIGFRSLGSGVLGQAGSTLYTTSYSDFRNALQRDITSATDNLAVNSLSSSLSIPLYLNRTAENPSGAGSATPYVDNNGNTNNSSVLLTGANVKALGFTIPNAQDGLIEFNSSFAFDFTPENGIDGGAYDFVGIAAHEIGHTLGFFSRADRIDEAPGATDASYRPTSLDLFRFSSASRDLTVAGYGTGVVDISADSRDKYFSLDRGRTSIASFSTGARFGDGRQASHWKDNQGIGIMDPTAGTGERLTISDNDLLAFDAIGYNLRFIETPEPSSLQLIGGAFLMVGGGWGVRRRKRRAVPA